MTAKLRVLSISTLFPSPVRPGFGLFVARQADAVALRDDIDLTVVNPIAALPWPLSRLSQSAVPAFDDTRGYPVHHIGFATIPRFGARWNPALIARAVRPLVRRLQAERPFDVVDAQFFYPDGPAAARIAADLGLPLSIKARGSDIHYWGSVPYARRQIESAAEQAARILAVSGALKADMAALGMTADKIAVHYTGLDHATFYPRDKAAARAQLAGFDNIAAPVPANMRLVVSTGNLIPLKGQALVIRVLAELPDTRLLLAGSGPDLAELRSLAADLGLADRVHFGQLSPVQLATALASADAMALPSAREGMANAWIEALACGTPLVITDVGGAREVVRSAAAGRLVARNPEAIAQGLRDLFANPPATADVSAQAELFSWQQTAADLAAYWHEMAAR